MKRQYIANYIVLLALLSMQEIRSAASIGQVVAGTSEKVAAKVEGGWVEAASGSWVRVGEGALAETAAEDAASLMSKTESNAASVTENLLSDIKDVEPNLPTGSFQAPVLQSPAALPKPTMSSGVSAADDFGVVATPKATPKATPEKPIAPPAKPPRAKPTETVKINSEGKVETMNPLEKWKAASEARSANVSASLKENEALVDQFHTSIVSKIGRKGWSAARGGFSKLQSAGEVIGMAVLFMVPSIFQSTFLAQQQTNALLTTYAAPIKFGNIVLQMPDSVIDMSTPAQSEFIYYGIPVDNVGDHLSAKAAAAYPGVTGPDKNNKVTAGIYNGMAKMMTLGTAKTNAPARYNLDATAQASLPIFVAYSDKSWAGWGTTAIDDPTFSQMIINVDSGLVICANGSNNNIPSATLTGSGASAQTVQAYLATTLGQLKTSGIASGYTEYVDTFSSSKGNKVGSALANRFDCGCLTKNNGVLSADTMQACSVGGASKCLLTKTLNTLAAGLIINSQGMQISANETLAAEVAKGALGQVIPIQGLGKDFNTYLSYFPGAQQSAIANSGSLVIALGFGGSGGSSSSTGSNINIQGADPDNYVAQGIYVYQCKNTPLAKALRSQAGGSATTDFNNHINDYIVFLDKDLNQVPLMVPMPDPNNYNFPAMVLNPAITYFSSIIGNMDSSNNFTLLPQMNITATPEEMAKGLPATYAPLYGLQAQGGNLSRNYDANLNSTIGAIVQSLLNNKKLGQQFQVIQAAMLKLLFKGPFGQYNLTPIDDSMQPVIAGTKLVVYTGFAAYPVSQDAVKDASDQSCTDILVPMSSQGKTVVLPSHNVANYYGLVSDLTYVVNPDGSIGIAPNGYANSPFSQKPDATGKNTVWSINTSKQDSFYWLTQIQAMGKAADPNFVMPAALQSFVQQCRKNWITWVTKTNAGKLSNVEFTGNAWAGRHNMLTIVGQQALVNNLYVYSCSPNPSSMSKDYFVLTNSNTPAVTDATLGTMKASNAKVTTNMLSLVSGLLYNSSGVQVKNAQGVGYQVDPKNLIKSLYAANPKGFSDDFKTTLSVAYSQYASSENMPVYPFHFGSLNLGMYQADINRGSYVYFDASGAGTSAQFQPQDYFVTVTMNPQPVALAQELSSSTAAIVSLVSGQVYGPNGPLQKMAAADVASMIASLSPSWRPGLKNLLTALTANFVATQQVQQAQNDATANQTNSTVEAISLTQAAVVGIIQNLAAQNYLSDPYGTLKYDPVSGHYVQISPAGQDGTASLYTFFNVPNSYKDAQGNSVAVGATYDDQGNLIRMFGDLELHSALLQNGLFVGSDGKEHLGAANLQPIMLLDPADRNLQPGATGKSMICSTSKDFPSRRIKSPVSYQKRTYYFYYNTMMKAYYIMEVNKSDVRYISIAGGNIYNLDGSSRIAANPVGVLTANGAADATSLLLAYLNGNGYTQCIMKNSQNNGVYSDFSNMEASFQANAVSSLTNGPVAINSLAEIGNPTNQVSVAQSPKPAKIPPMPDVTLATEYDVYWDTAVPSVYKVDPSYVWQDMILLPINMTDRSLLNPMPAQQFNNAKLVLQNNQVVNMLFANQFYSATLQSPGVFMMQPIGGTLGGSLTVTLSKDAQTGVAYCQVAFGSTVYNYQYVFDILSDDQLANYRFNVIKSEITVSSFGKVILVKDLPSSVGGKVNLASVTTSQVQDMPTDATAQAMVAAGVSRIMKDAASDRFVATLYPAGGTADQGPFFSYFNQAGYVDLETGALFDVTGTAQGYALDFADFKTLLEQLSVIVRRDTKNIASLVAVATNATASQAVAIPAA